jgi:hypothetical protein
MVHVTEVASRESVRYGLLDLVNRLREIPALQSTYQHEPEGETKWSVGDLTFAAFQPE